jgi:hypothetical protein
MDAKAQELALLAALSLSMFANLASSIGAWCSRRSRRSLQALALTWDQLKRAPNGSV